MPALACTRIRTGVDCKNKANRSVALAVGGLSPPAPRGCEVDAALCGVARTPALCAAKGVALSEEEGRRGCWQIRCGNATRKETMGAVECRDMFAVVHCTTAHVWALGKGNVSLPRLFLSLSRFQCSNAPLASE